MESLEFIAQDDQDSVGLVKKRQRVAQENRERNQIKRRKGSGHKTRIVFIQGRKKDSQYFSQGLCTTRPLTRQLYLIELCYEMKVEMDYLIIITQNFMNQLRVDGLATWW